MQANRDDTALRRIANRVIQQIRAQLAQQHAIAGNGHRRGFPLIAEIDSLAPRLLKTRKAAIVDDLMQVHRRERVLALLFPFDGSQLQQAFGKQNSTVKRAAHRLQALSPQPGIAARQRH